MVFKIFYLNHWSVEKINTIKDFVGIKLFRLLSQKKVFKNHLKN